MRPGHVMVACLALALSGCAAQPYRPVTPIHMAIYHDNADPIVYQTDLQECERYAARVSPLQSAVVNGAVGGAVAGAVLGAAVGGRALVGYGARVGAAEGAVAGAINGVTIESWTANFLVIGDCMRRFGYHVETAYN